jgi:hypothetical protein
VVEIEEDVFGYNLALEQTVEELEHLQRVRYAQHLPSGDLQSWCNDGPLGTLLEVSRTVMTSFNDVTGGLPSVVSCIDQTHVELAAWLAWAATQDMGCYDKPFWVIGRQGKRWQLVKDDPAKVFDVGSDWRLLKWADATACKEFLSETASVRIFQYASSEPLADAERLFSSGFLPHRLRLAGDHLRIVSRIDTFATGPTAWQIEMHASEQPPLPYWNQPNFGTQGKLLGEVAEEWASGEFVSCRMHGCPTTFPVRLTTFDGGQGKTTGWQWVPSQGNRICIDPSWSMRAMPSIRYAERVNAADAPYSLALPSNASWITRFGNRVVRFVKEGLQIE